MTHQLRLQLFAQITSAFFQTSKSPLINTNGYALYSPTGQSRQMIS